MVAPMPKEDEPREGAPKEDAPKAMDEAPKKDAPSKEAWLNVGEYAVILFDCDPIPVADVPLGAIVHLTGCSPNALNGTRGTLGIFHMDNERFKVHFGRATKLVRPCNIDICTWADES